MSDDKWQDRRTVKNLDWQHCSTSWDSRDQMIQMDIRDALLDANQLARERNMLERTKVRELRQINGRLRLAGFKLTRRKHK